MKGTFVLAQIASALEPEENLEKARQVAQKAVETHHADVLIFPEYGMSMPCQGKESAAESLHGCFVSQMRELAKEMSLWIIFGMNERQEDAADSRICNTTVALNQKGEIAACYRKTHLYDAFHYRESDRYCPGDMLFEPIDTPFGKIGLMVCYEVRFPEIARQQKQKGAEIIVMPTAWVAGELKSMHYNTLIRARAIENTIFVLACDQCHATCIGESVAVDPMGVTMAAAGDQETLLAVHIDTERIVEVSQILPSWKNRRTELY